MTPSHKYRTAASVLSKLDLDTKPVRFRCGPPFDALDLRPGRVIVIGAPPASGKTTLTLQVVCDALEQNPDLRAAVGNVEMPAPALAEKMLARFAGVNLEALQDRELLKDERARVDAARRAPLFERIAFLDPPFTMRNLGTTMLDFDARLCVVDYVQRFTSGEGDDRERINDVMDCARTMAFGGACVVLVSSVARQKNRSGSSTYEGLSMASFRGSSELEFGADAAFILESDVTAGTAVLHCEKQRYRLPRDINLTFDPARQTFTTGTALDLFDRAKPKGAK
jgi:replicative DNA helicase